MASFCVPEASTLADVAQKLRHYAGAARAPATLRSYQATWRAFTAWCQQHQRCPLPASAETAALFLSDLAGRYRPSTLSRMLSGIAFAHRLRGHAFDAPGCSDVLSGIRRTHGTAPRQVSALTLDLLVQIDDALPRSTAGVRDRALLLLGFAGALRRSELVGLNVGVYTPGCTGLVRFGAEGVEVNLLRSKTDQEAFGTVKGIVRGGPVCAVGALEQWLQVAAINEGPIFRSVDKGGSIHARRLTDRSVADIVKRSVKRAAIAAGLSDRDAEHVSQQFAGHSLRAGFATSAAAAGITGETMARHVGWTSGQMATRYVRNAELFKSNPLHAVFSGAAAGGAPVLIRTRVPRPPEHGIRHHRQSQSAGWCGF
jgi:integrase